MKKILIIALALLLGICLLAACGANENEGDTTDAETEEVTTEVATTEEATTEEVTTEEATTEEATTEETTTEELTTEEITTEEAITEEVTTEAVPEYDFSGAASEKLAEIAYKIANSEEYLIFTIGDSVTEGQGASNPKTTDYTGMFSKKLGEIFSGKSIYRVDGAPNAAYTSVVYPSKEVAVQTGTGEGEITVARCGIGGDTVARVLDRTGDFINKEIRGQTGKLFTICLGINESWTGTPKYAAPSTYKRQLGELVDAIYAAHPDADIILMTPPFVGDNPRQLDLYAKAVRDLAKSKSIACIDLNEMWKDHYVEGADNYGQGDWLFDNCHPTDIGHEAIADKMISSIFGIN